MSEQRNDEEGRGLTGRLMLVAVGMFGFAFLLVPLYDVFCDITGLNGKTSDEVVSAADFRPDMDRTVTIEFTGSLNENAPWEFAPNESSMEVHPGKMYTATYFAENLTDRVLVGQAVPSVAPSQAAKYLKKAECFCFSNQEFAANEGRDMPVTFVIDPELPEHIETLTLSYTFFRIGGGEETPVAHEGH